MIITDSKKIQNNYIKDMITNNTIITKIFENNITYIEDTISDKKILITENETYTIIGSGVKTIIYRNMEENIN